MFFELLIIFSQNSSKAVLSYSRVLVGTGGLRIGEFVSIVQLLLLQNVIEVLGDGRVDIHHTFLVLGKVFLFSHEFI